MKCIFCDKESSVRTFKSLFIKEDLLCVECRRKLNIKRRIRKLDDFEVEYFYDYKGIFSDLLLQYKECYDEALSPVFVYDIEEYIAVRYHDYHICFVPCTEAKMNKRGFHPMKTILKDVRIKEVECINIVEQRTQQGKSPDERRLMEQNFVYSGEKINKILIVDDVLTTGSTIRGVYNALKPHCEKIKVLVLACS